ncbi:hypothetical protein V6N13_063841 [Hibiscus sabdariffa]
MEDETYFFIRGRKGIKPSQIPSLMGFDEDATARAPPGRARTIPAARMAELTDMVENFQAQLNHIQKTSEEHPTPQAPPTKKHVASTSTATPQTHLHVPDERATTQVPPAPAQATVESDSAAEDEEIPDAPQPPAPAFDTSVSRRHLKRKANRNISMVDLATEDNVASDEEEDNGSSTTPEKNPMTSLLQASGLKTNTQGGEQVQGLRRKRCCNIPGRMVSNMSLQHWCTRGQDGTYPVIHVDS